MKICFVVGTLARGGAEKQLVFMLRAIKNIGSVAVVLCLTRDEFYEEMIRDEGVRVLYVGDTRNRFMRSWKIGHAIREMGADIIQSSHFYTNLYAGLTGRLLGIPSVGAVRSDLIYEMKSHRITGSLQISLPDLLITNSRIAYQRLLQRGIDQRKVEFVRNVVEVDDEQSSDQVRPGLKILFAGRLDENKRPERFVRLASRLTERYPDHDLQFQIAGDGEKRNELENTARKEMNLGPDRLAFLGDCGRMSDVYRGADILVSTSDREGTPNVVLEAMVHGIPIVATAVGGTKEILNSSRGFLVEPNDEAGLLKATTELIQDRDLRLRLGSEGRRYVTENHSLHNLQGQLNKIYKNLMSKGEQPKRMPRAGEAE